MLLISILDLFHITESTDRQITQKSPTYQKITWRKFSGQFDQKQPISMPNLPIFVYSGVHWLNSQINLEDQRNSTKTDAKIFEWLISKVFRIRTDYKDHKTTIFGVFWQEHKIHNRNIHFGAAVHSKMSVLLPKILNFNHKTVFLTENWQLFMTKGWKPQIFECETRIENELNELFEWKNGHFRIKNFPNNKIDIKSSNFV